MSFRQRTDGLCPRCGERPAMDREQTPFYEKALKLAATLDTELPPPLCEPCLLAFRSAVDVAVARDHERDQELWDRVRAGAMPIEDFEVQVNDRATYAEAIRRRKAKGSDEAI